MKKTIVLTLFCAALSCSALAQQDTKLSAEFDKVLKEEFQVNGAGATVSVSSHGKIIYKRALGIANRELNVPMRVNSIFRIASITKQFTAVATLQLMEKGKLNLADEITKFIPGYPVLDAKITIEQLLTHTSGIMDYTSIKDTAQRGKVDFTPLQMVQFIQSLPLRFAAGTKYEYSNSNYVLLGYIIESITGKTYAAYLDENIFRPLGMNNSSYASDTKIIRNRAAGYTIGSKELENAVAISMTQPYAAGSILSTVEDLNKWNTAIQSYKLIKKETLQKAITKYKLIDGKEINYGYGFRFGFVQESPSIWHGGLINGFRSMALYLPHEAVFVTVLSNCDCNASDQIAVKLAAIAIGKPYAYKEILLAKTDLEKYTGVYENGSGDQVVISVTEAKLYLQRGRGPKVNARAYQKDRFYFDDGMITMKFSINTNGKSEKLTVLTRNGIEVWMKSDRPIQSDIEVKVDEKILEMYTGQYEVSPQFSFIVTKEKDRLFLQATGQDKLEMFAMASNKFFLKVNDAQLEFVSESGKTVKAILTQGGRTTDALKIK